MTDLGQARQFAQTMTRLGEAHGVRAAAMITAMDTPLGRAVGNAVEVREALDVLGGCGPGDVRDLVIAGAEAMLRLAGIGGDPAEALAGGWALDKFRDMIRGPGKRPQPAARTRPDAGNRRRVARRVVRRLDARAAGMASWRLGAGRSRPCGTVRAAAGVICRAKPGERVVTGQPIVELRGGDPARLEAAEAELAGAIGIGDYPPPARPLVLERAGLLSRAAEKFRRRRLAVRTRAPRPVRTRASSASRVRVQARGIARRQLTRLTGEAVRSLT